MTGRIRTLHSTFGFITPDAGQDLFFHDSDLVDDFDLREGDRVTFDVVDPQPEKGPRAAHVALEGRT